MKNTIWFEPLTIEHFKDSSINMDKALGIQVTEIGDDYIIAKMPVTEKTKQPYGILHGGASCVLAESIGSIAAGLSMDHFGCTKCFVPRRHRASAETARQS